MDKIFAVRRLIDNDCYSCGGVFVQHLHFVLDEDVAMNHVEVLNEEIRSAQVCSQYRFKADDAPGLNRSNWEAAAREVLQFDKAYFDEDKTLGSISMIEYDYAEISAYSAPVHIMAQGTRNPEEQAAERASFENRFIHIEIKTDIDSFIDSIIESTIKVGEKVEMTYADDSTETVTVKEITDGVVFGLSADGEDFCAPLGNCRKVDE